MQVQVTNSEHPPGSHSSPELRFVQQHRLHGEPLAFSELCDRVVPTHTDYLVLDVDHTTHLNRNLGELLGWELVAQRAYGEPLLTKINAKRGTGRWLLLKDKPLETLRYLTRAAQDWALPGLFYLVWGKWLAQAKSTRPLAYLHFGQEPRAAIQRIPQQELMSQLATLPLVSLREMSDRIWMRHDPDQVVTRRALQKLRARCPNLRIILSSASPQPVLESAAKHLGADHIFYSTVEERDGYLSCPSSQLETSSRKLPRRISPSDQENINARENKITALKSAFPDIFEPGTVSVGITDTGYGEDHCWANHFDVVVDINSTDPFAPIIKSESPCREIHSAQVLSQGEIRERQRGRRQFLDSRRKGRSHESSRLFHSHELGEQLGEHLCKANALIQKQQLREVALAPRLTHARSKLRVGLKQLDRVVTEFNAAVPAERRRVFRALKRERRSAKRLSSKFAHTHWQLSWLSCQIQNILQESRLALTTC